MMSNFLQKPVTKESLQEILEEGEPEMADDYDPLE